MSPIFCLFLLLQAAANSQLGYRLTLPEDFVRITDVIPFPGRDIVDCWGGEITSGGGLILCVERLHVELGPQRLQQADLPPSQQLITVKWKDYEIDATRTDTAAGVIYAARVPLRREAIRVLVTARQERAEDARAILTQVLGSLQGESNWPKPAGSSGPFGKAVQWIIAIAIVVVLLRMVATRRRARAAPRGGAA
jgi:hypothetical protein